MGNSKYIVCITIVRTGRLTVRPSDDSDLVVRNFAKIWGLGREEIEDLKVRVEEEMLKYRICHYN